MFSLVRHSLLFRRAVILLLAAPMTFFGGSFLGDVAQGALARVGDLEIPRGEFEGRLQGLLENYRQAYELETLPPELITRARQQLFSNMLSEYLLRAAAAEKGVVATDDAVLRAIVENPEFAGEDGGFSREAFDRYVSDQFGYQRRLRRALADRPINDIFFDRAFFSARFADELAQFWNHRRVVDLAEINFSHSDAAAEPPTEEEIRAFYDGSPQLFTVEELAEFEYLIFRLDDFAASYEVDEEEIEAAYEELVAERRDQARLRAAHILFSDRAAAEEAAQKVRVDPESFGILARELSEDAASAGGGGDLGYVVRGDLPLEIEESLFAMEEGEIEGPVRSDAGFHLLKLVETVASETPPLAEIRSEIEARARRVAAESDFIDKVDDLRQTAYLNIGDLRPLAEEIDAEIVSSTPLTREAEENPPPFDDENVITGVFTSAVLRDNETTEPLPTGDDYIFARAENYREPRRRSLDEVRPEIAARLLFEKQADELRRIFDQAAATEAGETDEADDSAIATATITDDATGADDDAETDTAETNAETPAEEPVEETPEEKARRENTLRIAAETVKNANWDSTFTLSTIEDAPEALDEQDLAVIYLTDLTDGLPAYGIGSDENGVRLFRVREIERPEIEATTTDEARLRQLAQAAELLRDGYIRHLAARHQVQLLDEAALGATN